MDFYNKYNEDRKVFHRFFIDNKKVLAIIIIISISCLLGYWRYWYNQYNDAMLSASSTWQQVNTDLVDQPNQQHLSAAQNFSNANNNNYGALISIELARQFVEKGDFAVAEKQLQKALGQTRDLNLQSIINLRIARVQLQQKNIKGALKTLDGVKGEEWGVLAEHIRGDAEVMKSDHQAARVAYEKALQSTLLSPIARMKLNNLSN
ncbi:MAG: YfgM family protein [Sodalis sp. (in: enterobacteria)]